MWRHLRELIGGDKSSQRMSIETSPVVVVNCGNILTDLDENELVRGVSLAVLS